MQPVITLSFGSSAEKNKIVSSLINQLIEKKYIKLIPVIPDSSEVPLIYSVFKIKREEDFWLIVNNESQELCVYDKKPNLKPMIEKDITGILHGHYYNFPNNTAQNKLILDYNCDREIGDLYNLKKRYSRLGSFCIVLCIFTLLSTFLIGAWMLIPFIIFSFLAVGTLILNEKIDEKLYQLSAKDMPKEIAKLEGFDDLQKLLNQKPNQIIFVHAEARQIIEKNEQGLEKEINEAISAYQLNQQYPKVPKNGVENSTNQVGNQERITSSVPKLQKNHDWLKGIFNFFKEINPFKTEDSKVSHRVQPTQKI